MRKEEGNYTEKYLREAFVTFEVFKTSRVSKLKTISTFTCTIWDLSSVGLERCFDRAEVMGSNPLGPTDIFTKKIVNPSFDFLGK